ncbi:MAG TPA: copper-translocating P-type ATPase [Actinomycetes bacterium]|nr:copper-translocating P-type ATPase [Actinomycetes bacterium]
MDEHRHADHAQAEHAHGEHDKHAGHSVDMFRRRFWRSLLLTIPVVATSEMVMDWFGYRLDFPGLDWVGPLLGSVIFFWGGWPFLEGGRREVMARQPGMMLLISMAITVAYVASMATSLGWFELDFWWELSLLVTVMLLGHWQEMKALGQAQDALAALAALLPDTASRVGPGDEIVTVGLADLRAGDVVLVRPGERVPADATVLEGSAELDESMITGESRAVTKSAGDTVLAGTVTTDNALRARVTAVGEGTALAGIQRLVSDAQASSSRAQDLADRAAAVLFYVAAGVGLLTFVVWTLLGEVREAVTRTVTVLVIACPHALGLAIPLVIAIATERAARAGVLVRNRLALERMRTVDVVLFDKTGTLTKGEPVLTQASGTNGTPADEVLALAAAVETDSEHPVARAIVQAAGERVPAGAHRSRATDFRASPGRGVQARVGASTVAVGGPAMLTAEGLAVPAELAAATVPWVRRGASVLYVVRDGALVGALALEDAVRAESAQAIDALHARGLRVAMITGDARRVAESVAASLRIDEHFAEVLPQDKAASVAALQARGHHVAMVGDGVNDAPALAGAEVGIAIGAGTDVAIESADLVLASSDPRAVLSAIELSRASYRKMQQNLAWATGYNVVAIPLAAGVLEPVGVSISPALGAVLMSVSTIVVALNAALLRRTDLDPARLAAP